MTVKLLYFEAAAFFGPPLWSPGGMPQYPQGSVEQGDGVNSFNILGGKWMCLSIADESDIRDVELEDSQGNTHILAEGTRWIKPPNWLGPVRAIPRALNTGFLVLAAGTCAEDVHALPATVLPFARCRIDESGVGGGS